jgi:hypothetical protein
VLNKVFKPFYFRKVYKLNVIIKYMKLQLEIPKEINKALKIERIQQEIPSISKLIILILEERYSGVIQYGE